MVNTIITTRITTTIVAIRTEIQLKVVVVVAVVHIAVEHRTIGIIVVVTITDHESTIRDHLKTEVDVMVDKINTINSSSSQNKIIETIRLSIHAGKSHHSRKTFLNSSTMKDPRDLVENGINHVVVILITLYRYHVMNILNRSSLVRPTQASILANTKTFPWRRRDMMSHHTWNHSMISS